MNDLQEKFPSISRLTFIGYGEAAAAFSTGLRTEQPLEISSFDIKSTGSAARAGTHKRICETDKVICHDQVNDAVLNGDAIFSTVTANQALIAAQNVATCDLQGRFFFDCNSCAPQTKQTAELIIKAANGRYVDVAVMSPVHPKLHKAPMLISGPHAEDAAATLTAMHMNPKIADGPVGTASAIKLSRSIVVKGLEAICAEMILTARSLGVEDTVIASLDASYPGFDWAKRSNYALDRMMVHGIRRAAEMDEAAVMIDALGISAHMSSATAIWQAAIGQLATAPGDTDLKTRADTLLNELQNAKTL